ncbi:MAG: CHAT domain-containing protein [Sphingobium sp.]|uniref:CHAT domain-containing protein n=1 Tax=Sphingobium sp. TaxID=1912891 RepID=UPI0029B6FBB6|nr:CHAT domain-containing protein [Sphingobium sp.]MDX3910486.1 CHAT domain-containing protein [Sphingobium sp.]
MSAGAVLAMAMPFVANAQAEKPSLMDSFRIGGSGKGALCQAQSRSGDPTSNSMFDRAWTVACRDSAQPVGRLYALRLPAGGSGDALLGMLAKSRGAELSCSDEGGKTLADLGAVLVRNCRIAGNGAAYRITQVKRGKTTYIAQGFASYASALDLGLRTIVADKIVAGTVEIATLGGEDMTAFARLQAAGLDPQTVLAEGYRRNNSGNYAEAAEFFDSLEDRLATAPDAAKLTAQERTGLAHEYLINRALQLSNMGEFAQADALFAQARRLPSGGRLQLSLRRNFEAMHRLNQRDYAGALILLNQPLEQVPEGVIGDAGGVSLGAQVVAEINSGIPTGQALGTAQANKLTPQERGAIIDAQTQQLRGTLQRLTGKPEMARATLDQALKAAMMIRDGRVTSITRLRAQLLAEIALTYEAQKNFGQAEALLNQAVDLLAVQYPETVALNGARARLGSFLVRRGRTDDAIPLYRKIIASTTENRNALTGLSNQLQPWFALLAQQIPTRPELTADLFLATQTLVRPGAADTMEVLTRELSAGTGDAARLFRQSVSLARDVERARITLAQLSLTKSSEEGVAAQIAAQQKEIATLGEQQATTLAALAAYPQYRAVAKDVLTLADMQAALKPGEAYVKMAQLGDALYAVWIDPQGATGYRIGIGAAAMRDKVTSLRETISTSVNGVQATYPLDVELARSLYLDLFAPVQARLAATRHLIFEPDGAMLQLPANLLIASQPGVDAYTSRVAAKPDSEFDFRGIDWLGRSHSVSTALSARAFRDARNAPASAAARDYIGFGENAPVSALRTAALTRSATGEPGINCNWPAAEWNRPIPATELREAARQIGGQGSEVLTGAAFTDDAIMAQGNLNDFRILHFATHGLVTAPRAQCPARPALLTSFGNSAKSDGLLQFGEIFDLKLDADVVILSACDTAGKASREATKAAGLSGGGGALDGLVRAFIGAGGRSVIASHWPAPEEFKATERLINGLFSAPRGVGMAEALREAEVVLMDDADTSHPFYWSGFAIIGDGARPLAAPATVAQR